MAIDLQAVPMSDGFVQPGSSELGSAVAELEARTPLGATDMPAGLRQAADAFSVSNRARSIVYIGDGISLANLPTTDKLKAVVDRLVEKRISVSSFATGLRCNVEFLAVLANHSGGSMFLDGPSVSPQMAGQGLLTIARGSVVWPSKVELPKSATESYPTRFPPLRFDRDSVVLGTIGEAGDQRIRMLGELHGQTVEMSWTLTAEDTTNLGEDFAMLPELVKAARADHGLTSPILGTPGLVEARRIFAMTSESLSKLGNQALATGDAESARQLSDEALRRDPGNPEAKAVRKATTRSAETKEIGRRQPIRLAQLTVVEELQVPADALPVDDPFADDAFGQVAPAGSVRDFARGRDLLQEAMEEQRVLQQQMRTEVTQGLAAARDAMRGDPDAAILDLKNLRETVLQVPDLDAGVLRRADRSASGRFATSVSAPNRKRTAG